VRNFAPLRGPRRKDRVQPEEHLNSSDSDSVVQGTAQLDAILRDLHFILQLIAVPKARIEKMPFWAFFDSRDRFAHISMSSAQIQLKHS
jgi:hypothetical protein